MAGPSDARACHPWDVDRLGDGVVRSVAWGPAQPQSCPDCGGTRLMVNGEVVGDDATTAVFLAFLYDHGKGPEVYIDLILGPWGDDADPAQRLTFSTRTGPVADGTIGSTLLDGGFVAPDDPMLGTKVPREAGLTHPLLPTVWSCTDSVLVDVPEVRHHLASHRSHGRRRWPWQRRP